MVAMAVSMLKNIAAKLIRRRPFVQAGFLFVWLLPLGTRLHNICGPVFHCYSCPLATFACPIGVLAGFSALHVFPFFAVGMLLVVAGIFGAFICGWVCPFGFLQDLLAKIPTPRFRLPAWTTHLRYVVLVALVLVVPYLFGETHPLYICRLCPAGALEGAVPDMAKAALAGHAVSLPSLAKTSVTLLVLAAMFFTWRPWCTTLCPLGAIYGLANRFSAVFLRFNPSACNSCSACHKLCRFGVKPDRRANDPRCVRCLECTACPQSALSVTTVLDTSTNTDNQ